MNFLAVMSGASSATEAGIDRQVNRRHWGLWLSGLVAVAALAGCASDKPKPTELQALPNQVSPALVWERQQASVGFAAQPVVLGEQIALADGEGKVSVYGAANGQLVSSTETRSKLDAGLGFDGRYAAVVTTGSELLVLERGQVLWRTNLDSRVVTPPLVAGERVFVVGVDRIVKAFDAADGRYLWRFKRPGDALALAHATVLTAFKNTLIVGQGGRWVGLDPLTGSVRWDASLGNPRGTNEVERLSDLVGPAARINNIFCARSFQTSVGCLDAQRGVNIVSANSGGTQSVAMDDLRLYAADASDRITARRRQGGDIFWSSESLLYRELSGPAALSQGVVFGDFEGYLHLLDKESGKLLSRTRADSSPVLALKSLPDNRLLVLTRRGGIFVYQY